MQCGCLGLAALILLTGLPLGVSGFVSVGNTRRSDTQTAFCW